MNAPELMSHLRARGKPATADTYKRHGVREETLGVPFADVNSLARRLKTNHALALALWKTGVHDARIVATKIADASLMSSAEIERWLAEATNYIITDAIAELAARMPEAHELMRRWTTKHDEWTGSAGWGVVAHLAMTGKLETGEGVRLIELVQKTLKRAANRTRHAMNQALIAMGGNVPGLRESAIHAARVIGKVEVDHGETGCKTPDAIPYIERMVARAGTAKSRRVAVSRTKAAKSARRPVKAKTRARVAKRR